MESFSILIANIIFGVIVLLCTSVINLWHQKFVTADVIALLVNKQHGIQRQGRDFDIKFVFKEVHSKEVYRRISCGILSRKGGQFASHFAMRYRLVQTLVGKHNEYQPMDREAL